MFRLYVFDLDGTLVDSRRDLADSANELLADCGAPPLPEERIGAMVGEGAAVLVARVFAASGLPQPPDALPRFLAVYDRRLLNHTRPYPGVTDALVALGARAPLAVLTNKPLDATRRVLDGLGLMRHFPDEAIVGGDGPLPRKPDPAGLRHLASAAGVAAADTLLIGDSAIDLHTARSAGASICLARYGFGFATVSDDDLRSGDRIVNAPNELSAL